MDIDPSNITGLLSLLEQGRKYEDDETNLMNQENLKNQGNQKIQKNQDSKNQDSKNQDSKAKKTKDIWDDEIDDIPENAWANIDDPRPSPEYNMRVLQTVATEDLYLGMSGKNASLTQYADGLVLDILLPDTEMEQIDLSVFKDHIDLQSPK
jgi:hypothetical protein